MVELITLNQILILAITNILSGIFIGFGIAIGIYRTLKKQMPKWIHEIVYELKSMSTMEKAMEFKRGNIKKYLKK